MKKLSYSSSGVSINKGNKFVSEIKKIIRKDKNLKIQYWWFFRSIYS